MAQRQHATRQPLLLPQPVLHPFLPPHGRNGRTWQRKGTGKWKKGGRQRKRQKSKGKWKTTSWGFQMSSMTSRFSLCVSSRTKALVPQLVGHSNMHVRPADKAKSYMEQNTNFFKNHLIIGRPSYPVTIFFFKSNATVVRDSATFGFKYALPRPLSN